MRAPQPKREGTSEQEEPVRPARMCGDLKRFGVSMCTGVIWCRGKKGEEEKWSVLQMTLFEMNTL